MDLADAVTATSVAVGHVGRVCVDHCDVTVLRSELKRLKTTQSQLDAQVARLTHAADAAGAFIGTGARDTAEWLGTDRHLDPQEPDRRRAAAAGGQADRRGLAGPAELGP